MPVIRDALNPHKASLIPQFWNKLESAKSGDPNLLPASGALALFDPESPNWKNAAVKVASELVAVNPVFLAAINAVIGQLQSYIDNLDALALECPLE